MVVFGGLNIDNFCNAELHVLELDPFHAKRMHHEEKNKPI